MAAGATFTPIATVNGTGSSPTVSFTSIPSTYTDLVLITSGSTTTSGTGAGNLRLVFNSDTSSSYSDTSLYGTGTSALSGRDPSGTFMYMGMVGQASEIANSIIHIMNYSNTSTYKTIIGRGDSATNYTFTQGGLWRATPAVINRIDASA